MPSQTRLTKLDFPEKLIQTGKKENTEALLKRLKDLHGKLAKLEQDATDIRSLDPVRKPLISPVILHHKDRGVKAYAACCLADLLRLYAPDAPYTAEELRDIFQFYVTQLTLNLKPPTSTIKPLQPSRSRANELNQASQSQQLSQPQASQRVTEIAYYNEYCYLLESLATIKSVVLACDVPNGGEIITSFFKGFTDIVRPDMSKSVIRHLTDILVWLVEEVATVPSSVFDVIVSEFEDNASKPETPSFQLIVDVCNRAADRFQRPLLAHFSEIQLSHGRNPSDSDLTVLRTSHNLLLTIYRFCPGVLLNVIPLLEENLRAADEVPMRELSTRTLGRMFGERPIVGSSRADLAKAYPSAWRSWLGRKVDKDLKVRLAWVESARGILVNHPELRKELEAELQDRIHDSDERVRAAICKVVGGLDYETALHHVGELTLKAIGGRISDKKASVRAEAAAGLGKLWSLAYSQIEANDPDAVTQFGWIPEAMLHALVKKDATLELRTQITQVIRSVILPLPKINDVDEQVWTDRLLLVASHLDDPAFRALERLTGLQGYAKGASPYRAFVEFCEQNNGGVIDEDEEKVKARLEFVINAIARLLFVDVDKAKKDMESFAAANEHRLYRLFQACCDVNTDLRSIVKARHEMSRRLEQSHTDILETMTLITDSASWYLINHSSIPGLIAALQRPPRENGKETAEAARRFLYLIAKEGAPMFKSHVPELLLIMTDKKNEMLAEAGLQALAAVCKADPASVPSDKRVVERAKRMAMDGTPKQAKYAARFLANCKQTDAPADLIDDILASLKLKDQSRLVSMLSALSELALSSAPAFELKSEEITKFTLNEVILKRSPSHADDEEVWVEESELRSMDRAKLVALKLNTHRVLGYARGPNAEVIVQPVINLCAGILATEGMVNEKTMEGARARCHLRLRAASCLLKLAKVKIFDTLMTSSIETISLIMQDPCQQVRYGFLLKLAEALPSLRLLPRWITLPAWAAQDPEAENVALARSIIASVIRACAPLTTANRVQRIELPFARLIHGLTHHPDTTIDAAGLKNTAKYIEFYLDCVAHRDNIGLLYQIAAKIKTVRDVAKPLKKNLAPEDYDPSMDPNKDLYALCELAEIIIRNKAAIHQWTITTHPVDIKFPKDVFHNVTSHDMAHKTAKTRYLPDSIAEELRGLGKKHISAGPSVLRKISDDRDRLAAPKKRAAPSGTKSKSKKKRRPSKHEDDDDDDEEEDDSAEEDEEEEGEAADAVTEEEEEEEEDGVEAVVGRGGKRGAKTKAKKAVAKKVKKSEIKKRSASESDLTDMDD